jgi:hypothetical protein
MPKYSNAAAKGAQGVAYVAGVAAASGCVFHSVDQGNDLGIDGFLELVRNNSPANKLVALQIKTGASFWQEDETCRFAIDEHRSYWEKHPLPTFGIVVNSDASDGAWVNIKQHLKNHRNASQIVFRRSAANRFDADSVRRIMIPLFCGETADLEFETALSFLNSSSPMEVSVGLDTLFRRFGDQERCWSALLQFFIERPVDEIPYQIAYYIAHIPWHGDIFGYGKLPDTKTTEFAKGLLNGFGCDEIRKLVAMVDEKGIERGAIGQSVEAIISAIPNSVDFLLAIVQDPSASMEHKQTAVTILAMHRPEEASYWLSHLASQGSDFAVALDQCLKETGWFNPYG